MPKGCQVTAGLLDGTSTDGTEWNSRSLGERHRIGHSEAGVAQTADTFRIAGAPSHNQGVDPLRAQSIELTVFDLRGLLGVGHHHRVSKALGLVLDSPQEGQEYRIGQIGDEYPDDHRPVCSQAARRCARLVVQTLGGGADRSDCLAAGRTSPAEHA
jgi:hypothetical protein